MPFGGNDWLELTQEETLEPDLPICDPHHHFWDFRTERIPYQRYLLHELADDVNSGHNVRSTVFVEARAMYRSSGPDEMKPVGEVEFVQGLAAASESGLYGPTRAAASIVGHANLNLGDAVEPVLEALQAASPNRFRGIRHSVTWDPHPEIEVTSAYRMPGPTRQRRLPRRRLRSGADGAVARRLAVLPATARTRRLRQSRAGLDHHPKPRRRTAARRSLRQRRDATRLARRHCGGGGMPERRRQARRNRNAAHRLRLARTRHPHRLGRTRRRHGSYHALLHRAVRTQPIHVREQLPRWTRYPTHTTSCTTPSSGCRPATPRPSAPICSTTWRRGCTGLVYNGTMRRLEKLGD